MINELLQKATFRLGRAYTDDYNCLDFVQDMVGEELCHTNDVSNAKGLIGEYFPKYEECEPYDGCIVQLGSTHIGIYIAGYIFHNDNTAGGVVGALPRNTKYKIRYVKKVEE